MACSFEKSHLHTRLAKKKIPSTAQTTDRKHKLTSIPQPRSSKQQAAFQPLHQKPPHPRLPSPKRPSTSPLPGRPSPSSRHHYLKETWPRPTPPPPLPQTIHNGPTAPSPAADIFQPRPSRPLSLARDDPRRPSCGGREIPR